jgi:hypothetical protein
MPAVGTPACRPRAGSAELGGALAASGGGTVDAGAGLEDFFRISLARPEVRTPTLVERSTSSWFRKYVIGRVP